MSESLMLCMFSLAMFFGSYLSGLVPLAFNLSESKMRYVTVLGAGLLVGTALAVIVPEGVHALYLNQLKPHEHPTVDSHVHKRHLNTLQEPVKEEPVHLHEHENEPKLTKPDSDDHSDSTHSTIGITLILGFVFMLIVDNCGSRIFHHHGNQVIDSAGSSVINKPKPTWTATLGLVVHAAADGIALGAASATSRFNVELIVFMAIMLHKAPAAFGLVSFLISDGVDRKRIRRHLIIFSLAAPLMALFTFVLLKSRIQEPYSMDSTGIAMLFSAGTFLFVATVHVLPEVQSHNEDRQFRTSELLILILGCTCPIILSMGHKH